MAEQELMPIDTTGFLDSHRPDAFGVQKKILFLNQFEKCNNVSESAKVLSIPIATITYHLRNDPAFKAQYDAIQQAVCDRMEERMIAYGQKPKGFMDRIAYLKAYRPWRWREEYNGPLQIDVNIVASLKDKLKDAIEAAVVVPQLETADEAVVEGSNKGVAGVCEAAKPQSTIVELAPKNDTNTVDNTP